MSLYSTLKSHLYLESGLKGYLMMAITHKWVVFMSLLITILDWSNNNYGGVESARVPAMFVFGDSLVDVGNNNYLSSIARANYFPYGVDFSIGPTGRFSNGKTFVDILGTLWLKYENFLSLFKLILCIYGISGEMLGVPYPSAFADPTTSGARILGGVNYASAAGGILDETGQHYVILIFQYMGKNYHNDAYF